MTNGRLGVKISPEGPAHRMSTQPTRATSRERQTLKPEEWARQEPKWRFVMASIISLIVLGGALYVILSDTFSESAQKWACGAVGMIVGYWLNPRR